MSVVTVLLAAVLTSPVTSRAETPPDKRIVVELSRLRWQAEINGLGVNSGKAVGGAPRCSDMPRSCKTPAGTYVVLRKFGYVRRSDLYPLTCKEKKLCGSRLFWQVKFHESGYSIHGVGANNLPNRNASHGCIRVSIEDSKWIRDFVEPGKTKVVVLDY